MVSLMAYPDLQTTCYFSSILDLDMQMLQIWQTKQNNFMEAVGHLLNESPKNVFFMTSLKELYKDSNTKEEKAI